MIDFDYPTSVSVPDPDLISFLFLDANFFRYADDNIAVVSNGFETNFFIRS